MESLVLLLLKLEGQATVVVRVSKLSELFEAAKVILRQLEKDWYGGLELVQT